MDSLILRTAARIITPLQLAFSVVLLIRGHNEPGGGFIGGLVAACGIMLYAVAHGIPAARRIIYVPPPMLIAGGLFVALTSGLLASAFGLPYMKALWDGSVPTLIAGELKFGTPLLFDTGVFLTVIGIAVHLGLTMMEDR